MNVYVGDNGFSSDGSSSRVSYIRPLKTFDVGRAMRLVILQPFYLPYPGVFELVRLADTFCFYDDVQFVRQGWQQRNRIKTQGGEQWLTVPVLHEHGQLIKDVLIDNRRSWETKHLRSLHQAYAKAPHRELLLGTLSPILSAGWKHLAGLNIATFRALCNILGVDARFSRSSELSLPGRASARVLAYCQQFGASRYLSGPAGRSYLDEAAFAEAGIQLEYLQFNHPRYAQLHGSFVPYLSAVDLIANAGQSARKLLTGSGRPVLAAEYEGPSL